MAALRPALRARPLAAVGVLIAALAADPVSAHAAADTPPRAFPVWIEPAVLALCSDGASVEREAARAPASLFRLDAGLAARGRIRLQLDTGRAEHRAAEIRCAAESAVPSLAWEGDIGSWAQVTLAVIDIPRLGEIPGLAYVQRPPGPLALARSEGAAEIGAGDYQRQGFDGHGISIGVVDLGFSGVQALIGHELPADTKTRSFYGSTSGEGDLSGDGNNHGTACAEIVHDVAPGARLCLANAGTAAELDAAVRWLQEQGVAVISHSVGWFFGPGDGTGPLHEIVNRAIDAGIVWVNAAGNQAGACWVGTFSDADGDDYHEFVPGGDESITLPPRPGVPSLQFILVWDRWPYSTDLRLEIEIRENGVLAASSAPEFDGSPYAYRHLDFTPSRPLATLDVAVRRTTQGGDAPRLRLFRIDGDPLPEHGMSSGSIILPADGPRVLSVGAYRVAEGFLEEFSSRGPTMSGTPKPELCAPDGVTTATTSPQLFGGTSAACPHAAGAVALLLASSPPGGFFDFRWDGDEIRALLAAFAQPANFDDPHATLWGLLRLPPLGDDARAAAQETLRLSSPLRPPLTLDLPLPFDGELRLRLLDIQGRALREDRLASCASRRLRWQWDGRDARGRPAAGGPVFLVVEGSAARAAGRFLLLR